MIKRFLSWARLRKRRLREWLLLKLAKGEPVIINCRILDYDVDRNSGILINNRVTKIVSLIEEEMYAGSPGKKIIRKGNSFVLTLDNVRR